MFMPHPGEGTARICLGCDSHDRHRALWLFLRWRTNIGADRLALLHLAPERILKERLSQMSTLDYTTADLESELAELHFDLADIPIADDSFDLILCSHVLEHVPDDRQATSEMLRVLKPRGAALIQIPMDQTKSETFEDPTITSPEDRARAYWQADHLRLYGQDFETRLNESGFHVERERFVHSLGEAAALRYGLGWNDDIFVCRKPAQADSPSQGESDLCVATGMGPVG
jgi:SAM-dependent methyltransferase